MKLSEINNIINQVINEEVKNTILKESSNNEKEVYHIKLNGEPIATFNSREEAEEELPKYKAKSKGELIIEKGMYESYSDMIDKLDEMGEQLDEKENSNMKNQEPMEGNTFTQALIKAKKEGKDKFEVDGEEFDVTECWKQLEEEELYEGDEEDCMECNSQMEEQEDDTNYENEENDIEIDLEIEENQETCNECGGEMKEGVCNECGNKLMEKQNRKKVLRLKESEMIKVIEKIVMESLPTATVKAQTQSKKDNEDHAKEVAAKIKKSQTFDGNDNPEFPKPIGKGEKVARKNTPEQEKEIEDNRGGGLEDLDYDIEPSEQFKQRLKKALDGDSTMGNSQDAANVVKSNLGKKIADKVERKKQQKKDMVMYNKDVQPVKIVKESTTDFQSILNEEIEKMKKIANYDKKTQ